jgi:hypothetical protein
MHNYDLFDLAYELDVPSFPQGVSLSTPLEHLVLKLGSTFSVSNFISAMVTANEYGKHQQYYLRKISEEKRSYLAFEKAEEVSLDYKVAQQE